MDQQGEEQLDQIFDEFLAFTQRVEDEAKARLAESGEKPITMLVGTDRKTRTIAIVPLGEPPDEAA